MERIGKWAH